MRGAAVLVHQAIAAKADEQDDGEDRAGQEPAKPARLAIGDVDQTGRGLPRPQDRPEDHRDDAPAQQHVRGEHRQRLGDADQREEMPPRGGEGDKERRQAGNVAGQQSDQAEQGRSLGAPLHAAAGAAAQAAGDAPLDRQRDQRREPDPGEPGKRAERRAVAVKRAPFAAQRLGNLRRGREIVHRLGLELADRVLEPAGHLRRRRRLGGTSCARGQHQHRDDGDHPPEPPAHATGLLAGIAGV